ncbi:MAG: PspC domain-containing protein [Bacteroidales bacterium]|nr:PspC domain-containing protein [Bacteroidales bacterium]
MKTTENISIGGLAFTIESDAYDELNSYLNEISACFSNDPSGNEIVEDIEVRISELIKEKCPDGAVVGLETVKEIKKRIGDPKELGDDDTETTAERQTPDAEDQPQKRSFRDRRLFRDIDNRVVAGVCSGLGEYFDIDRVIFRVLFSVMAVIGLIGEQEGMFLFSLLAYIILWIAIPAARTVEEKCEMRRKPIDLEGFKSKENRFEREVKEAVESPAGKTLGRILLTAVGIILLTIGMGGLFSLIFIPSVHEIIEASMIAELSPFDAEEMLAINLIRSNTFWWMIIGSMSIAFIGVIYSGIMLIFDLKRPVWKPGLVLFIAWLISFFVLTAWILAQVAEWLPTII